MDVGAQSPKHERQVNKNALVNFCRQRRLNWLQTLSPGRAAQ